MPDRDNDRHATNGNLSMDDCDYTDAWERTDTVIMERPEAKDLDEQPPADEEHEAANVVFLT